MMREQESVSIRVLRFCVSEAVPEEITSCLGISKADFAHARSVLFEKGLLARKLNQHERVVYFTTDWGKRQLERDLAP